MNKIKYNFPMWLTAILLIVAMTGCEDRMGITSPPIISSPTVTAINPANLATDVPMNQRIAATFSKTMDASTITSSTFYLLKGSTPIPGYVSYNGLIATFAPLELMESNTEYTVKILTGAKDQEGNGLENVFISTFTSGATIIVVPPSVSSTDPSSGATGVPLNQKIAATFSVAMDASSITASTFTLKQGSTSISAFVSYYGTTAILAPTTNLASNTVYTATITTGAKDLTGNPLVSDYTWNFTTGSAIIVTPPQVSATDPLAGATEVPLNQKISATFTKSMNAATITTATFTLMQGSTFVSGTVSYVGTTATYFPTSNLVANTTYTATITTGAVDLTGNALESNYVWSFTTGGAIVIVPPVVILTDPLHQATGVPLNQKIAATFSKTMDATTITNATFVLAQGANTISGFVSYSGTTAIFTPAAALSPNTVYSARITTGAKDLAGNALANNYIWTFTTGAAIIVTPPVVNSTDPLNQATGVPLNKKITATFSKTMDATTITTATFVLTQGSNTVSGFVSYLGTTATFTPATTLLPNTLYSARITTGAKDLAGNALANDYIWSFTTGASVIIVPPVVVLTDPLHQATGVPLNQKVAASFSKTMDANTINSSTFTLTQGANSVSGFVSYSGITAIFAPAAALLPNTVYTARITTGAKDLTGTGLVADYVWTFATGAAIIIVPPVVTSTDPLNLAIGVPLNKKITATFSKTMDATTITSSTFILTEGSNTVTGFVSYSGTTATLTPASTLLPNTLYSARITTGAKDLAGNALASDYVWSFTTGASIIIVPPVVVLTDPLHQATEVPLNQKISATFSKAMDASTITTSTFILTQGAFSVTGFVSYSGMTALFTPASALLANTVYNVRITTGVKDLSGTAMVTDYVWTFTTGSAIVIIPPTVISTDPLNNAVGVALNKKVNATFSKPMDASTITTATFTLMQGSTFVSGSVSLLGNTATYTPSSNLLPNTTYTATITTGAKDLTGTPLANNYVWSFTTISAYTVSLSSLPTAGGTTTGSGTYNSGSLVTVNAIPNSGYNFTNWTENSVVVSTSASYVFTITGNRSLVANFAVAGPIINLGAAAPFGGFGGSAGMTNQGIFTIVNGDIGSTAASTLITGFHDGGGNVFTETPLNIGTVTGTVFCAPPPPGTAVKFAIAQQALLDATAAFNFLAGLPGGPDPGAGELGGLVLAPGTYTSAAGTFKITSNNLTLDAQNNPNAIWVFQMAQTLTVGVAGQARSVILINGAQAKNVYWVVGSAATINGAGGGTMVGTIISYAGVTFSTAGVVALTTLNGRALSLNASVTLVNTIINVPAAKKSRK